MGFKGFSPGLICRGKQYAENALFKEMDILPCESGLHYCENPLEVLSHYPLINGDNELNEYAEVYPRGKVHNIDGAKFCTGTLYVDKRLSLKDFVVSAFKFKTRDAPKREWDKTCIASAVYAAQLVSMTHCAHIATACNNAIISSGGNYSHLISSGDNNSVLSVGNDCSIASSGECVQIVSEGARVNIVASGKFPKIYTIGDYVNINSSNEGAVVISKGKGAVISATGKDSKVKAGKGSIISLTEWSYSLAIDDMVPICIRAVMIDGEKFKENTFYTLRRGEFVEVGKEEK